MRTYLSLSVYARSCDWVIREAAIDAGYEKAFTAILDANVTTGIAAVVLYQFGSGQFVVRSHFGYRDYLLDVHGACRDSTNLRENVWRW